MQFYYILHDSGGFKMSWYISLSVLNLKLIFSICPFHIIFFFLIPNCVSVFVLSRDITHQRYICRNGAERRQKDRWRSLT